MIESTDIDLVLRAAAALTLPENRSAAARELALTMGAEDLIIFVRDSVIGQSLPAAGFPQTLHGGRTWRALIAQAIGERSAEGRVEVESGTLRTARALAADDGTVAVLIGGKSQSADVEILRGLLPLFGAAFRAEADVQRAQGDLAVARQSAATAAELAAKLDAARADLQRAVTIADTATRARDDFLATVSHELRTPLTSIIGWIQLLREEHDPVLIREALETIDRNARSQSRLIEDILDFSRINAGKLRLRLRPVKPADAIRTALEVVRPAADAKKIKIETSFDVHTGTISADPERLLQVISNLLSNAVKFTPRDGTVRVEARQSGAYCEITVTDTGMGISPEFLPFVFDRFSQADTSTTREHGGLGLGLGIVKHLVELHGGSVEASSSGLGRGATFRVRLPVVATRIEDAAAEQAT